MTEKELLGKVDHTLLKAFASWEEIEKLCREAVKHHTASVCVPPCYIHRIRKAFADLPICTVVGFPLGYSTTQAKIAEVKQAVLDGADEIDMVINLTDVKNGDYGAVEQEIAALKKEAGDRILKVIIETCYLTEEEKIRLCEIVTGAGADYIKTSTGFGTSGATLNDIRLFKAHIGSGVKMKAAGGIRTVSDMQDFINEGCSRIGTSSAVSLIEGKQGNGY